MTVSTSAPRACLNGPPVRGSSVGCRLSRVNNDCPILNRHIGGATVEVGVERYGTLGGDRSTVLIGREGVDSIGICALVSHRRVAGSGRDVGRSRRP